jgi:hypothetical protein
MHPILAGKSQQSAKNTSASSIGKYKSDTTKVGRTANASGYKTRSSATDVSSVQAPFKSKTKPASS